MNSAGKKTRHRQDERLQGHVLLAVWSYLLHKALEHHLSQAGSALTPHRALEAVNELRAVKVEINGKPVWKCMPVESATREVFAALGITRAQSQFQQWAKHAPPYQYEPRCAPTTTEELIDPETTTAT